MDGSYSEGPGMNLPNCHGECRRPGYRSTAEHILTLCKDKEYAVPFLAGQYQKSLIEQQLTRLDSQASMVRPADSVSSKVAFCYILNFAAGDMPKTPAGGARQNAEICFHTVCTKVFMTLARRSSHAVGFLLFMRARADVELLLRVDG